MLINIGRKAGNIIMKIFTFSFDDGTVQDRRLTDLFNSFGFRGSFNINSGFFGNKHRIKHIGIECDHSELTTDDAVQVYKGHEICAHTKTHPDLRTLDFKSIIDEVEGDRKFLEDLFETQIFGMAYPGGGKPYNDNVIKTILENTGIRFARTILSHHRFEMPKNFMEWHPTCDINDTTALDLAEDFINMPDNDVSLFYIWGHSFEFDKLDSWNIIEKLCSRLSQADGLINLTNGEIYSNFSK